MSLLSLEDITRRYPGTLALNGVDLRVEAGTVHALVGENGAGKSTLLRVLAGAERPDRGTIRLDDVPTSFPHPRAALDRGVTVVYQELALVPELGADANIFLGMERTARAVLDREGMREAARDALLQLGLAIDPTTRVARLSIAQRQLVELARALVRHARIIALDEPTATLTPAEVDQLFDLIGRLKAAGTGIVFVSHRLDEIRRIADTVTVLRDGAAVWSGPAAARTDAELIRLMVGRDVEYARLPPGRPRDPEPLLEVTGLSRTPVFRDVSFALHRGEIVALAGLIGAGRSEVARCLAGADRWDAGRVRMAGRDYAPRDPRDGIARRVVYLPEDRKRDGLILGLPVGTNTTLPVLRRFARGAVLDVPAARDAARGAVQGVGLRPPDPIQGNRIRVPLRPYEIATVLVECQP